MLIAFIVVLDILRWKRGFGLIIAQARTHLWLRRVNSLVPLSSGLRALTSAGRLTQLPVGA